MDKADRAQGTGAEPEQKPSMSMSKAILLVSVLYLIAKSAVAALCYYYREPLWNMKPSTWEPFFIAGSWVLPVVVVAGTLVWQWKSPSFRWLSVIGFVVWMAGIAFSEIILWAYLRFGPTGEISPI